MDPTFLNRNVNEGFSGGEKKRNEILQLAVLEVSLPMRVLLWAERLSHLLARHMYHCNIFMPQAAQAAHSVFS